MAWFTGAVKRGRLFPAQYALRTNFANSASTKVVLLYICKKRVLIRLGGAYVYAKQVGAYLANGMLYSSSLKEYVIPCAPCTNLANSTSHWHLVQLVIEGEAVTILTWLKKSSAQSLLEFGLSACRLDT
jgi:hypothetical protein